MAKKFFPDDWEKISSEEMVRSCARLSGFIESIPEKDKAIHNVSILYRKTVQVQEILNFGFKYFKQNFLAYR
jgi:hypothetical protein